MSGRSEIVAKQLRNGDEKGAAKNLRQAIEKPVSGEEAANLYSLARSMDRNDLALGALNLLPETRQNQVLALNLKSEMGEDAADALAALLLPCETPDPGLLTLAGAYEMEGRADEAISLIEGMLETSPDWLEGHRILAQLLWTAGERDCARSMRRAVAERPDDEMLRASWLGTLKSIEDHGALPGAIDEALRHFPQSAMIAMVSAEGLSELGQRDAADRLFGQLGQVRDPGFDAARIRHEMRHDRPENAARIGAQAVTTHGQPECWAWFGAALRALDDPRADWFYRDKQLLSAQEVALSPSECDALASKLRSLHRNAGPPFGQSPRGGTQTLGPLLKRRDPEIVRLREELHAAVRRHIDALPPVEPQHPCLRQARGGFRFEGSWSILLRSSGHHVPHIHSHGWISSAIYIDLPDGLGEDQDQKGWLQIGTPPLTGGKDIAPLQMVAPARLKLALFPSLFWHGTLPFDEGERLTVAFDVLPY